MSVIIRLQNLPWSANALDIRQYFSGLSIPEGGVHIVGGTIGDCFIAFSTDEDARQAFNRNNGKIKDETIRLMLSSRTEMQNVIEEARRPAPAFMPAVPMAPIIPSMIPSMKPELKVEPRKEERKDDRRDRDGKRRSRSKSRDRKDRSDRSRDRDRRRHRDRSRSRDRRDRRRDRRSRSRDRTRSKDRDRKSRDRKKDDYKSEDDNNRNGNNVSNTSDYENDAKPPLRWELPANKDSVLPIQGNPAIMNLPMLQLQQSMPLQRPALPGGNLQGPFAMGMDPHIGNNNNNNMRPRFPWAALNNPVRNPNMDGPGFRMDFRRNNMDGDQNQNNFNRMGPTFQNMDNRNANNGQFPNRPPFLDRQDNRMGFGRPPMMGNRMDMFNHQEMNGPPPQQDFNNFNNNSNDLQRRPQAPNCCVQLQPFFGGYSEVRRFFSGLFINNSGLKFVNDESGKRTGIVYVRFALPEGKRAALDRNGSVLKNLPVEVTHLDDSVFESVLDSFKPTFRDHDEPRNNRSNQNQHFGGSNASDSLKTFSCITLEDVPCFIKEHHIFKLFGEYPLVTILLVDGRNQRDAFVKFTSPEDAKSAIGDKSKHLIDGNQISIRPCSLEEFDETSRQYSATGSKVGMHSQRDDSSNDSSGMYDSKNKSDCVYISGLPYKITDRDIADFFSDIGIVPTRISLQQQGQCYCEFGDARKAELALLKHETHLGTNMVSVETVTRADMEHALSSTLTPPGTMSHAPNPTFQARFPQRRPPGPVGPPGPMRFRSPQQQHRRPPGAEIPPEAMGMPGCVVALSNIPFKASTEEILGFFEGYDIDPNNVFRRRNPNGTLSGDARVTFQSPADAIRAVEENNQNRIRERTVYLSIV